MYFFFDTIHDSEYVEYVYELLMLLDMLCKNKDFDAIHFVKDNLNFTPEVLLKIATSANIHILYRIASHHLFIVTWVWSDPERTSFIRNRYRDMCFKVDEIKDPET